MTSAHAHYCVGCGNEWTHEDTCGWPYRMPCQPCLDDPGRRRDDAYPDAGTEARP